MQKVPKFKYCAIFWRYRFKHSWDDAYYSSDGDDDGDDEDDDANLSFAEIVGLREN